MLLSLWENRKIMVCHVMGTQASAIDLGHRRRSAQEIAFRNCKHIAQLSINPYELNHRHHA